MSGETPTTAVGVVIAAYNAIDFLTEAVDSVVAQTRPADRVVIVDDGSTDGTADLADQLATAHPNVEVVHQLNSGPVAARNRGLELIGSSTEWIMFLDADDWLLENCLRDLLDAVDGRPELVGSYGLPSQYDHGAAPIPQAKDDIFGAHRTAIHGRRLVRLPDSADTDFACMVTWVPICTGGQLIMRRSTFVDVGAFSPSVPIGEDWDAWLRLTSRGDLAYVPHIVMFKREHPSSYSKDHKRLATAEPIIRNRLGSLPLFTPEQRSIARRAEAFATVRSIDFARSDLRRGDVPAALKNVARSIVRIASFSMLRLRQRLALIGRRRRRG